MNKYTAILLSFLAMSMVFAQSDQSPNCRTTESEALVLMKSKRESCENFTFLNQFVGGVFKGIVNKQISVFAEEKIEKERKSK